MQKSTRRLGVFFIVLASALLLNITYIQVLAQRNYIDNPANTRRLLEEYGKARGKIMTSDGTVLAESQKSDGPFAYARHYPEGWLFSHVVGYDSPQFGRSGLEEEYNDYLLGAKPARGWVEEMTGSGEEVSDLYLTLDRSTQSAAASALGERNGAVVALDPRNGDVLAIYSWPVYDPNALVSRERDSQGNPVADAVMASYRQDPSSPLLNRGTMGLYTPGSSFKVVTSSAGIESGFPVDTEYDCPAELPVDGSRVVNYSGSPTGVMDMNTALTYSVNTYFAQLALNVGGGALVEIARRFGLNRLLPLDYPAVAVSSIPDAEDMDAVELAWTGAGQGELQLTPLQLCLVGCAVANRGEIMTPHFLKEVRRGGEILDRYDSEVWSAPVSETTAENVLEMMRNVVAEGTGSRAAIPGVAVAGKTGTAQVEGKPDHAWFVGIAPVEDPRVVVAVIVEYSGGGGGSVAAPIARQVMEAALEIGR